MILIQSKLGQAIHHTIEHRYSLQVYRATGDFENAKKMYDHYSEVTDDGDVKFLSLREIVLAHRIPRKMFVQHNTVIDKGDVKYVIF